MTKGTKSAEANRRRPGAFVTFVILVVRKYLS
jgi:hypothetical protein